MTYKKNKASIERDLRANKTLVMLRANYVCENPNCDADANGGSHHIHFSSQGGSNLTTNLIALCMKCHDSVHGKVKDIIGTHFMVEILENIEKLKGSYTFDRLYFVGDHFIFSESLEYLKKKPSYLKNKGKRL